MKKNFLVVLLTVLSFVSCGINDKNSYLKSYEDFIVEIEMKEDLSREELTEIKKEYLDYSETYYYKYEADLTEKDLDLVEELNSRYDNVLLKYEAKKITKDIGEGIDDLIDYVLK